MASSLASDLAMNSSCSEWLPAPRTRPSLSVTLGLSILDFWLRHSDERLYHLDTRYLGCAYLLFGRYLSFETDLHSLSLPASVFLPHELQLLNDHCCCPLRFPSSRTC